MDEIHFRNKYRVTTTRAAWHNYNGGAYFITICTKNRIPYFGEIYDNEMHLSLIGNYTQQQLQNISSHYSFAEIPLWVVMPNHLHTIVLIDHNNIPYELRNVEAFHGTPLRGEKSITYATQMQSWLSVVIRQFKQSITHFAIQNKISFEWQRKFHDRIIRNTKEMNVIARYIELNVSKWEYDRFYV